MENTVSLDVQLREVRGKKVKALRRQGLVPATVYGKGFGPVSIQLQEKPFTMLYHRIGRSALVRLNIPGYPMQSAFVQEVQRHPISRDILHADFHVVNLLEKMRVEVPITLVGTTPLIERGDAVLNQVLQSLEVFALPAEVPQHIEIDISVLTTFDKAIHVSDLPIISTYDVITGSDEVIVSLTQTRAAIAADVTEEESVSTSEPQLIREERDEVDTRDEN